MGQQKNFEASRKQAGAISVLSKLQKGPQLVAQRQQNKTDTLKRRHHLRQ